MEVYRKSVAQIRGVVHREASQKTQRYGEEEGSSPLSKTASVSRVSLFPRFSSTQSFYRPILQVTPRMSKRDSPARLMAKDLIAGCFGGIGIVAVGHPFDTIKVHIL